MFSKNQTDIGNQKQGKGHSLIKHMGMMGLCCLLPLLLVSILPLLNLTAGGNTLVSGLSSLICPIMMGVMMFSMLRSGKKHDCCSKGNQIETDRSEES